MTRLLWNQTGDNKFETGVDRGVLFVYDPENQEYKNGVAWNGLTSVSPSPTGAEANPFYADNIKYLNLMSAEEFGLSLECYTYPDEFALCDGSHVIGGLNIGQQVRNAFGFAWRTRVGNEVVGDTLGEKLHIAWNLLVSPSENAYTTVNESPEPLTMSYEATSTAVPFPDDEKYKNLRPTAYMSYDTTHPDHNAEKYKQLTDLIWGSESEEATLPTPAEVADIFLAPAA